MVAPKVDGGKLKRALEEFGSLEEALEQLRRQKNALQADVSALNNSKSNLLQKVSRLERTINEREGDLNNLDKAYQKYKQGVENYKNSIGQFMLQYNFFESLVAMLLTSPAEKKSAKDLATRILMMGDVYWKSDYPPDKLRYTFVQAVLGEQLGCYRCNSCGIKFIVNKEPKNYLFGYSCPGCGAKVGPDDSFLKVMLGSLKKPTDITRT